MLCRVIIRHARLTHKSRLVITINLCWSVVVRRRSNRSRSSLIFPSYITWKYVYRRRQDGRNKNTTHIPATNLYTPLGTFFPDDYIQFHFSFSGISLPSSSSSSDLLFRKFSVSCHVTTSDSNTGRSQHGSRLALCSDTFFHFQWKGRMSSDSISQLFRFFTSIGSSRSFSRSSDKLTIAHFFVAQNDRALLTSP